MNDPAPLREKLIKTMRENITIGDITECSISLDGFEEAADAILAALPTDAVQPVGGVDREALVRELDHLIMHVVAIGPDDPKKKGTDREYEIPMARRVWREVAADVIHALYATAPTAGSGWLPIGEHDGSAKPVLIRTPFGVVECEWDASEQEWRNGVLGIALAAEDFLGWLPTDHLPAAPTDAGSHDFSKDPAVTGKFFKHWACEGDEYAESSTAAPTVGSE